MGHVWSRDGPEDTCGHMTDQWDTCGHVTDQWDTCGHVTDQWGISDSVRDQSQSHTRRGVPEDFENIFLE